MKKQLTITDFLGVIPVDHIHSVMVGVLGEQSGEAKFGRLNTWLEGQTMSIYGMYEDDLRSFLVYDNQGKEAPVYD